jgi:hypothetical protein
MFASQATSPTPPTFSNNNHLIFKHFKDTLNDKL